MDENGRMAELIRRIMRGGLSNSSPEDVNRSPFTSNIRQVRNLSEFKLSTLEVYDGRSDTTIYLMRYIRHMEVLETSEEVMTRCFPLYLTESTVLWFRQLENGSIRTWNEL